MAADAKLAAEIGDPWGDIAKAQISLKALYYRYGFMEARAGIGSDLFRLPASLVRAAAEKSKPNGERLPEYTDSRLALLSKTILDPQPVYPELEQVALEFWLSKLRENLTADATGTKIFLGKDLPETLSARLAKSKLSDPAMRKALWDGGMAAIQASDDPMIKFVLATDPASRAMRKEYEEPRLRPGGPRGAENRPGAVCDLWHQHLSRCDLLAAPELRQGRRLERQWRDRAALHLL